jgi:hypothetical protein
MGRGLWMGYFNTASIAPRRIRPQKRSYLSHDDSRVETCCRRPFLPASRIMNDLAWMQSLGLPTAAPVRQTTITRILVESRRVCDLDYKIYVYLDLMPLLRSDFGNSRLDCVSLPLELRWYLLLQSLTCLTIEFTTTKEWIYGSFRIE